MRPPLLLGLALVLAVALPSPAAAGEPLRIENLQVAGGEETWHASNAFRLSWTQVPGPPVSPRAVVYRVFDSAGHLVAGPVRNAQIVHVVDLLEVLPEPGAYTVEVWLEDEEGRPGPASRATLRFDDTVPPAAAPQAPEGWLAGHETAILKIGHPAGDLPPSGIRGYAFSLDPGGGSSPCLHPGWCSDAETDLPQGIDDDTIALGTLPEGETFVRVVAVSGAGVASPVSSVVFRSDATLPRLSLQGLAKGWSSGPVRLSLLAADELSGMAAAGPTGPFAAIAVDGGPPALAAGDSISGWVAGSGVHEVAYFARDAAGNLADGAAGDPLPPTATIRIDEEPPRVLFAAAQDPSEPERIEATVADPLSGPSPERGSIRVRRAGSSGRFEELPTRVAGDRLIAHWDSDSYPAGKYEFLATGYDLAGNAATGTDRARGGKMVLVNPLKTLTRLEAGFGARRARRIPFGRGKPYGGRLLNVSGAPLAGQEVAVTETFAPGSQPSQRTTRIRTRSDGTFSLRLAPGPSREVGATFAGTRTLTRASAGSVRLEVSASVRLRASAARAKVGGRPVVFSGRVAETGVAPLDEGLPVELQFRYPGAKWSAFRTVQADARGRFRYAYRFSDDDSRGVRFQFRAYVKGREGWPYEPAYSRPVAVTGR
ncbi:MAG TPA: carboxypeptidase-like regulatory domain-containing protein [Solirubrobacterales bacterium]|nr:carboxypeptidase-like regulatory domain-containing protein [Solirubrobacterales bacterium]